MTHASSSTSKTVVAFCLLAPMAMSPASARASWPWDTTEPPKPQATAVLAPATPTDDVASADEQTLDTPEYKRVYTQNLTGGFAVKLHAHSFLGDRYYSGELVQQGGESVTFDPGNIADKVLNQVLLPAIQNFIGKAEPLDRAYMRSNPSQFVDGNGETWRRVPGS